MLNDNNTEPIIHTTNNSMNSTQVLTERRWLRKCSYCKEFGHNIKYCNHVSLCHFHETCIIKKATTANPLLFAHWIALTSLERIGGNLIIKAYGISKHGCRLRDNMHIIIEKITNNLYNFVENINENYVRLPEPDISNSSIFNEMIGFNLMVYLLSRIRQPNTPDENEIVIKLDYNTELNKHIDSIECGICYETKKNEEIIKLNCNHDFCKCCIKQIVNIKVECPYCRTQISQISYNTIQTGRYFIE